MIAPTVFALTEVRGKSLATNTIGTALRRVMAFHLSLDVRGINFAGRLTRGELLSLGEVEYLARLCRRYDCFSAKAAVDPAFNYGCYRPHLDCDSES